MDQAGITFESALLAIGYRGPEKCGAHPLSAFFELHIEQGPLLEAEGKDIGIVIGVQGIRWFEVTLTGRDAHSAQRRWTVQECPPGAARLIERIDQIANSHAPVAVGTVGLLQVKPNSPNVVPGEVFLTVDLRHPQLGVLDIMEEQFRKSATKSAVRLASNLRYRLF